MAARAPPSVRLPRSPAPRALSRKRQEVTGVVRSGKRGEARTNACRGDHVQASRNTSTKLWRSEAIHLPTIWRGKSVWRKKKRRVLRPRAVASPAHGELEQKLKEHEELRVGTLSNGLRYVVLPNAVPPRRFEAHLEVHTGSVDEKEEEQGVAHLVEHVTFLGSRKREGLLGTGCRSNAYTDFHHTVFHVHAPLETFMGAPLLPQVLEALREIAFEPEFLPGRIEKERRAVLAEAQMMNTMEYRVDCQLLHHLHAENALGYRFPIGKPEQVKKWDGEVLKAYHKKWYFPANATLYLVGDFQVPVDEVVQLVEQAFEQVPPAMEGEGDQAVMKTRHAIRPPVEHRMGLLPAALSSANAVTASDVKIFRHNLIQQFSLTLFSKLPVLPVTTLKDLRRVFMTRIVLSVFQFRINAQYVAANPPFLAIELDHSDSGREGCAVSTLTITSEPNDWKGAVRVAMQEMRRLRLHGVTKGEMDRYADALLRDSEQLAEQNGSVPSVDNLDFVMESLALGHTVMDPREGHEALLQVANTVTLEDVNDVARSLFSFAADYGSEDKLATAIQESEEGATTMKWDPTGWNSPTLTTAVIACIPAAVDPEGGPSMPLMARPGGSMATSQHVDSDALVDIDESIDDPLSDSSDSFEIEGEEFVLSVDEIHEALVEDSGDIEPVEDFDVPDRLLSEEELQAIMAERKPSFVPVEPGASAEPAVDPVTGVVRIKLSNGVTVNCKRTANEPRAAMIRLNAAGGRALEGAGEFGAVSIGTRALSEAGTVAQWGREQVELFCVSRLINCVLEAEEEFITMEFHFAVGDGGLEAVFELLHLVLEKPCWEESSLERSKQLHLSNYRTMPKSLERATADKVYAAMFGDDRRFRDPNTEEIEAVSLEQARQLVMEQLKSGDLEVSVVGDFDEEELKDCALKYLGTLQTNNGNNGKSLLSQEKPVVFCDIPHAERHQRMHIRDSDERACAYIGGPSPNAWGLGGLDPQRASMGPANMALQVFSSTYPSSLHGTEQRRTHPLYYTVSLSLLAEIINSRLFTTVRDSLGLTYDVSLELSMMQRLSAGWYMVNVTSTPQKIDEALMASVRTMRGLTSRYVTERELDRARRTLLTRHESDMKDDTYCLGLLQHLQSASVPQKSLSCLRDLQTMYEAATVEDIYYVYRLLGIADDEIYTCVGTSGDEAIPAPPNALSYSSNNNGSANSRPDWMQGQSKESMAKAFAAVAQTNQFAELMKAAAAAAQQQGFNPRSSDGPDSK